MRKNKLARVERKRARNELKRERKQRRHRAELIARDRGAGTVRYNPYSSDGRAKDMSEVLGDIFFPDGVKPEDLQSIAALTALNVIAKVDDAERQRGYRLSEKTTAIKNNIMLC